MVDERTLKLAKILSFHYACDAFSEINIVKREPLVLEFKAWDGAKFIITVSKIEAENLPWSLEDFLEVSQLRGYILKGASERLTRRWRKVYRNVPFPRELREYIARVRELEGVVMEVDRVGEDTVLLRYDKPIPMEGGGRVVGIEVDKDLVRIL